MPTIADDELLDQATLAAEWDKSEATLEKWRSTGQGPPFVKIGRSVRYWRSDAQHWLRSRTVRHTAEPSALPSRPRRRKT